MKLAVEVLLEKHVHQFAGKRIGLATNLTSVDRFLEEWGSAMGDYSPRALPHSF
jgi:uncharacterized protein YbbC (DUF1343 family)